MKRYVVRLSGAEREYLRDVARKGKVAARKRMHAQVLLRADVGEGGPGWTDVRIAEALGVGVRTVETIRQRSVEEGLESALNRKKQCRPSRERLLDGEQEAKLIAISCGEPPSGRERWTLRLLAGWRGVTVTERRARVDWARRVKELLDGRYREAKRVTLIMDNLNTHVSASLYAAFDPAEARRLIERLEFVYTPKHGSWLNIAEIEMSALARQWLNRRIADRETLSRECAAWEADRNRKQTGVDWYFTTADARTKLKRLYPRIQA